MKIDLKNLRAQLDRMKLESVAELLSADEGVPISLELTEPVRVDDILSTFQVRRQRYIETGIPSSQGVVEFVGALEAHAGGLVRLGGFKTSLSAYTIAVDASSFQLLGIVAIDRAAEDWRNASTYVGP